MIFSTYPENKSIFERWNTSCGFDLVYDTSRIFSCHQPNQSRELLKKVLMGLKPDYIVRVGHMLSCVTREMQINDKIGYTNGDVGSSKFAIRFP